MQSPGANSLGTPIRSYVSVFCVMFSPGSRTALNSYPPEENDRRATGVRLFTAAALALVQPDHPIRQSNRI